MHTEDLKILIGEPKPIELTTLSAPSLTEDVLGFSNRKISVDICALTVSFQEVMAEATAETKIWADLFRPLGAPRSGGKCYSNQPAESLFPDVNPMTPHVGRHQGFRQAFREARPGGRVDPSRFMSIWDRILPILEPPLNFDLPRTLDLPAPLRPYQVDGVKFLLENGAALLGDDMGTGKTVQATVALRVLFQTARISSALIVCPLSVLRHWDLHLEKWAPLISPNVVRGSKERRQGIWSIPAHVWITTFDTLRQDIDFILDEKGSDAFDLVVLDEVQRIKNPGTGYSKAVKRLNPAWRWGFSGTPIENSVDDLVSIFGFLKPELFFRRSGYVSPVEARNSIRPYFLRRRKEDVLKDLPQKTISEEWLPLEGQQREAYDKAEQEGIVYLKRLGHEVTVQHVLALMTHLKQVCNIDEKSGESAKATWLEDFMEEIVESETKDKAIVFSQFLKCGVDWLAEKFQEHQPLKYIGAMSDLQRERVLCEFKDQGDRRLFLMTRAGGVGINLTMANYVVHFDHWWNPATVRQAEDRVHRIGQEKKVFVYHLWTENTVEERVYRKLQDKQRLYDEVIDALSNVGGTGLSEDELFEIFGLQNPKKKGRGQDSDKNPDQSKTIDVSALSPDGFEGLIADLYSKMGYGVRKTPHSRDKGIDVIATRQSLSVAGVEKVAIQCKKYEAPVGEPVARNLLGAISADPSFTRGVIVTNSIFSADCKSFCHKNGRIELIDGKLLDKLLRQFMETK
jgi:superfamily II DNA or RNA helicase